MRKTTFFIVSLSLILLISFNSLASSCQGELYGINAGRGDIGILFKLDEINENVHADSVAKFSSAALSYDSADNQFFYISAPRAKEYKVDVSHLAISDDDLKHLPILGNKFRYTMLAVYNLNDNTHKFVGRTKRMIGLVYDPINDNLIGHDFNNLYQIDKLTGETTTLTELVNIEGKFRGDLVIKNEELLLVTSQSIYKIDRTNYNTTKLSDHGLSTVTGATIDRSGDLIVSRTIINDLGHVNKSTLHKVNPISGNSCLAATFPVRINDLTSNTSAMVECYSAPLCVTDAKPTFTLTPIVSSTMEGGKLSYKIELSNSYYEDVVINLAIENITTNSGDYSAMMPSITIAAGSTSAIIEINTITNDKYSETKELKFKATAATNAIGEQASLGNILNDDPQCVNKNYTRIHYNFIREDAAYNNDWGIKVNGQFIKLLDEYGGSGNYDVIQGQSFSYALGINGSSSHLSYLYRWQGNIQQWEDWVDYDYNDFEVSVWTQTVAKKECN